MDALANFPSIAGDAMEKIVKDQEEFEKEHQFMQVSFIFIFLFCLILCFSTFPSFQKTFYF